MSLPGADELFRTTGGTALQPSSPRTRPTAGEPRVPAPAGESDPLETPAAGPGAQEHPASGSGGGGEGRGRAEEAPAQPASAAARGRRPQTAQPAQESAAAPARRAPRGRANRRPSGRERHDEKITVYVSAEELMDLEHARLVLRGEHGLAVDRGRIVREAVAVVLADLEQRGDASILVRRLRGR
ncbi:hypothetical protein [Streptomyces clavuligerus]|uniref:Uncharacterized protein n=1 Tax=Streptomyces clavuligerus TaxID=1901 RepID=E2PXD8_STRCL|nr:hypothetical protein [Streptomyces clavuligerus]ANW20886.1 hypothetical protein BB341_23085 [Streptomyces clavuligerus]AXU15509.1 hypothetical protein D1794_23995 [Streptomyces clavuligerus]EFG06060.1 Hypothetical protein SCLAV_0982 [Streptomyces clavuligerus]MBY6305612.1 hypothetical protein [Streptomyces clavuligerus]QCS08287.1 hypothetical protein CRV15_23360 [Streptomyces clavuligerus]